jgi:predicted nucleic acid-binding protein
MIALDTNILLYVLDVGDARRQARAAEIVLRAAPAGGILAQQVLGEFVHASRRIRDIPRTSLAGIVAGMRASFDVVAASPTDFDAGLGAHFEHGIPFWDALIWATVRSAGCRWLLTEDYQDGRSLGGVTFVNPFTPANDALVDRILPPLAVA